MEQTREIYAIGDRPREFAVTARAIRFREEKALR